MVSFLKTIGIDNEEIKQETASLFTVGSLATLGGSVAGVKIVWAVLASLVSVLKVGWVPLGLSFLVVYGAAYFTQNPSHLTREQGFVAFFNAFIVYSAVLGIPI